MFNLFLLHYSWGCNLGHDKTALNFIQKRVFYTLGLRSATTFLISTTDGTSSFV